ncbi:hypothetical protein JCM19233_5943 [Vibrio astriarenae]|nr:hypothetical protein JCM19233_5943 [Vibrio sp. C7]
MGPHEIPDADSGGEGVWASTTYNANYSYFGLAGVSNSGNACAEVGVRAYETYRECDGREGVCWDATVILSVSNG